MKFGGKCYCHACHTRFAIFFLLPSCCVSSLMSACKAIAKLGEFQTDMRFVMFASWATISYRRIWQRPFTVKSSTTSRAVYNSWVSNCSISRKFPVLKIKQVLQSLKFSFIFRFNYYSISFLIGPINHSALLQLSLFLFTSLVCFHKNFLISYIFRLFYNSHLYWFFFCLTFIGKNNFLATCTH